ncbi:MAG: hypothetical protein LBJ62_05565 [Bifidobacteriaceae bacterium]|jgi:hypothetical protein|nr:hypothetical protein [Bifidobacteriaceae bacterium]
MTLSLLGCQGEGGTGTALPDLDPPGSNDRPWDAPINPDKPDNLDGLAPGSGAKPDPSLAISWTTSFLGRPDSADFKAVASDPSGGVVIGGYLGSRQGDFAGLPTSGSALLIRLDATGQVIWAKTFGGSSEDIIFGVAVRTDGSIVAVGDVTSTDGGLPASRGTHDAVALLVSPEGEVIWVKTFGGSDFDGFRAVTLGSDGSILVAGFIDSDDADLGTNPGGGSVVAKLDQDGELIWIKNAVAKGVYFSAITTDGQGNLVVAGSAETSPDSGGALVARLNHNGDPLWVKTFRGDLYDQFHTVAVSPRDGIVVAGELLSDSGELPPSQGGYDAVLANLSLDGEVVWAKTSGGANTSESIWSLAIDAGGGVVAVGWMGPVRADLGPQDGLILRLDRAGSITWEKTLGGSGGAGLAALTAVKDGFVAVGGSASQDGDIPVPAGQTAVFAVKLV